MYSNGARRGKVALVLWESTRHEAITEVRWSEEKARATIAHIASEAEDAYDHHRLWPASMRDGAPPSGPRTSVYFGAAGVAWALQALASRGFTEARRDWLTEAARFVELHRADPDIGELVPSFLLGELGVRIVADQDHDRMFELIESNTENPSIECLWGAPGTMVPAITLYERTGDDRWRELYLRNAKYLIAQWHHCDDVDAWLWSQDMYGHMVRHLGAGHGFAGNVFALLRGYAWLSPAERSVVVERTRRTLATTARRASGLANWPQHVGVGRPGRDAMLTQWCHGAPGMITSLATMPCDDVVDALLVEGGQLTWQAGPLTKGPGLCHGTAGNGYALLTLAERTGDAMWLRRARRFGMHAIEQLQRMHRTHDSWHSLWTGDLGVAMYLADCIDGETTSSARARARAALPCLPLLSATGSSASDSTSPRSSRRPR